MCHISGTVKWRGKRAKNSTKWQKILSVTWHISGTIHHMIAIYCTRVKNDNISRGFLHLFKILIFWVVKVVKGQKLVQNDKKTVCCTPYLRNHTSYDFPGCQGGERVKNDPKWQKFLSVASYISGTIYHMIFMFIFMYKRIISWDIFFFFFFKVLIFLTAIWLSHGQLWAILKGTASLTWC